ncbi:MAG: molybdopterin-guanine dinucleotide biosynthesis protein B [Clostridia bacterium]|nr:molybdopterin-guanine dinucleotide biosynthesis protein B [Clostridia bacterium]
MSPIVSVVGRSNSGKTTLVVKLLRELKQRGYRVATIKHSDHDFEIDRPGKDTWGHYEAGADIVVISTPAKMAMIERLDAEIPLDRIAARLNNVDLIITEGYKHGNKPKIEVHRAAVPGELISPPEELLAVASDEPLATTAPCYDLDDAAGLVDLLEAKILSNPLPSGIK